MANVTKVHAREIFDSRGNPTVEVEVTTSKGILSFKMIKNWGREKRIESGGANEWEHEKGKFLDRKKDKLKKRQ